MTDSAAGNPPADADFEVWRVYDDGSGPVPRLVVRYRDGIEAGDWRNGPDLSRALEQAVAAGWEPYDREPGDAPGEVTI